MGRPLNKKYFGNRNIGTGTYEGTSLGNSQNYEDDKIGGQGIASINWSTLGSFMGNSNVPVLTVPALPAPTLPGGVQATWSVLFEVESVTTGAGKTNLAVGDTFGIASVPGLIAKVTDLTPANAIFSVTTTGASRGTPLAVGDIPQDTQTVTMTKIAGTGTAATFVVDIFFRVASATITEKGSGYTGAETFTFTKPGTTSGTVPAGTDVLTTSTGAAGTSTNQENAIIAYAYLVGSELKVGDIVKQTNDRRYKVKTADGTGICQLATELAVDEGFMNIVATDSAGGTYFVRKLLSRKAVLVPAAVARLSSSAGTQFASGTSAKWTFGSAVLNTTVTIENA
jgi:hypothetical protein